MRTKIFIGWMVLLLVTVAVSGTLEPQAIGARTVPSRSDFEMPAEMVLIPAGEFAMGDAFAEGCYDEIPVHTVTLSAYYISRFEVTNDEMVEVLQWAWRNGRLTVSGQTVTNALGEPKDLVFLGEDHCRIVWTGNGFDMKAEKASGYPCSEVSWYGAIAYCNFRSEMEGLTPCYSFADWSCNWSANGYRLPTDAEWEKAARGGVAGRRFPWGDSDLIDHTRANYASRGDVPYDVSPTRGFNPDYAVGEMPYTSPVGSFPPNGYGLYAMPGNVWEWCWDYWDSNYYMVSPSVDPLGPATGDYRVVRSGRWGHDAENCRVAGRRHGWPGGRRRTGLRVVLSAAP